jgi:hypothetical protein
VGIEHSESRYGVALPLRQLASSKKPSPAVADQNTARNSDLWAFLESMKQMEDRFNHWARYDYVFLNEEVGLGFPPRFQADCGALTCRRTFRTSSNGEAEF